MNRERVKALFRWEEKGIHNGLNKSLELGLNESLGLSGWHWRKSSLHRR